MNLRKLGMTIVILVALLAAFVLSAGVLLNPARAQQYPVGFNEALADLGNRVGRTLTLNDFNNRTSRWEYRGVDFSNTALDCAKAGESPTAAKVIGYQFIFVYRNVTYDYRVEYNKPETLRLCTEAGAGQQYTLATLTPAPTAGSEPPAVLNTVLADLGRRLSLNLTLADFDTPRSYYRWAFREFRNSQLECPAAGVTTDRVFTDGWILTLYYERTLYEYRAPFNNPDAFFLCKGEGRIPPNSPTPRAQPTTSGN